MNHTSIGGMLLLRDCSFRAQPAVSGKLLELKQIAGQEGVKMRSWRIKKTSKCSKCVQGAHRFVNFLAGEGTWAARSGTLVALGHKVYRTIETVPLRSPVRNRSNSGRLRRRLFGLWRRLPNGGPQAASIPWSTGLREVARETLVGQLHAQQERAGEIRDQ